MKMLLKYLKNYKKELFFGPLFKLLEAIFELIVPIVMAKIIDNGIGNNDSSYIIKMSIVIVILGVCGLGFALTCQYLASKCAYGFATELRTALYKHINTLSHSEIDKIGVSSLINRLTNDTNTVQNGVNMFIRLAVRAPFLIIGATVMAMTIDLKLSLVFLVVTPIVAFVIYKVMSKTVPLYKKTQAKLDEAALITRENLEGTRVIRAFSRQEEEIEDFNKVCGDLTENMMISGKISAILNPVSFMIMNLAIVAVLWFGGVRINTGSFTQGELTAFVNYMTQISLALVVMANLVVIFTKAGASASRVNEIFDETPDISDGSGATISENAPAVEFKEACFDYGNNGEYELEGITFSVNKGETIGIIGSTGSGKSTLINLIPRFYDTAKGEVFVDGANVKDYIVSDLRRKIGIVPQKSALFSGTVRENLTIGNENASEETIKKAPLMIDEAIKSGVNSMMNIYNGK